MAKTPGGVVLGGEAYEKILYVSKERLAALGKLPKGKVTDSVIQELVYPEDMDDTQLLVPIDVSEAGEDFPTNAEDMIKQLGAQASAKAILDAAKLFQKSKANFKKEERPIEMTVGEWMSMASIEEDEEEEDAEGDEEEEGEEEEEVEDDEEDVADNKENDPAAKKRKTA